VTPEQKTALFERLDDYWRARLAWSMGDKTTGGSDVYERDLRAVEVALEREVEAFEVFAAANAMEFARDALQAVLLFHSGDRWDKEKSDEWRRLTGREDVTTRALCDVVREALGEEPRP
jgi:hypothetical protein